MQLLSHDRLLRQSGPQPKSYFCVAPLQATLQEIQTQPVRVPTAVPRPTGLHEKADILWKFLSDTNFERDDDRRLIWQLVNQNRLNRLRDRGGASNSILDVFLPPFSKRDDEIYRLYQSDAMKAEFVEKWGPHPPELHSESCRYKSKRAHCLNHCLGLQGALRAPFMWLSIARL